MDSTASPKMKTMEKKGVGTRSLAHNTSWVEGRVGAPRWGVGGLTNNSIIHMDLHKLNNKLVSAQLEHLWCMDKPWETTDSQNSPQLGLGGSHHLPLYSIVSAWPQDQHPNVILSRDSLMWISKFPKLGLLKIRSPITLCADLRLRWGLKKSCSLIEIFPTVCGKPLAHKEIREILDF
jgi:hypothetical protein